MGYSDYRVEDHQETNFLSAVYTIYHSLKPSIAEGLSGPIDPETITFPVIKKHVDRILTVTEEQIIDAIKIMLDSQYIVEPSGAAGVAALKQYGEELNGRKVAIVVTKL